MAEHDRHANACQGLIDALPERLDSPNAKYDQAKDSSLQRAIPFVLLQRRRVLGAEKGGSLAKCSQ
jgi:hypothetical protein